MFLTCTFPHTLLEIHVSSAAAVRHSSRSLPTLEEDPRVYLSANASVCVAFYLPLKMSADLWKKNIFTLDELTNLSGNAALVCKQLFFIYFLCSPCSEAACLAVPTAASEASAWGAASGTTRLCVAFFGASPPPGGAAEPPVVAAPTRTCDYSTAPPRVNHQSFLSSLWRRLTRKPPCCGHVMRTISSYSSRDADDAVLFIHPSSYSSPVVPRD